MNTGTTPTELRGLVLCGGQSLRMGRDKGLLQTAGRPWVLRMGEKLAGQGLPVIYSINRTQVAAYSAVVPPADLVTDSDEVEGPLAGLLAAHRQFPDSALLAVACDMQDLDKATITGLIEAWRTGAPGNYAYRVEGVVQPFCAIYAAFGRTAGITSLSGLLRANPLWVLQGDAAAFRNYNSL